MHMPGQFGLDFSHVTTLQGTSALQCAAGIVGNPGSAGKARDTQLLGLLIRLNATAATLTIGGFGDNTGAAANVLFNGQTTLDVLWHFPNPLLNEFGPMVFTPSVAGIITVFTRPYIGP